MEEQYLIWSVEHQAWWARDSMGYVHDVRVAGLYPKAVAEEICRKANRYLSAGVVHEVMIPESVVAVVGVI